MGQRGRKRKSGERRNGGRLVYERTPLLTPEMERHRAELLGPNAKPSDSCVGLTILLRHGIVTQRQVDAGEKYRGVWMAWKEAMGLPCRYPERSDRGGVGRDPMSVKAIEAAEVARKSLDAAEATFIHLPHQRLIRAVLDDIVLGEWEPMTWVAGIVSPNAVSALTCTLDCLADYFNIPGERPMLTETAG